MSESEFGGSRRPIVEGVRWSAAGRVSLQLTRIAVTLALARLLGADDFGLMGAALVVVNLLDTLQFSTGAAIVQRERVDRAFMSSLFVLNAGLGLGAAALLFGVAPLLARAYGQGELLADMFRVLAVAIAITGLSSTHRALLRRRMDFAGLAVVDLLGALANGGIAILLALRGYGVWSMVLGLIGSLLVQNAVVWVRAAWLPSLRLHRAHLREVSTFTTQLTLSYVLLFAFTNLDALLITRYLGTSAMGYYALAQRVMNPSRVIVISLIAVLNPALAHVQNDLSRVRRDFGRAVGGVVFLVGPILVGIAVSMRPFTAVVLGPEWAMAVPIAQILVIPTLLGALQNLGDALWVALKRVDLLLRWIVVRGALLALGYGVGLQWGLQGLAWGGACATALAFLPAAAHPLRLIGSSLRVIGAEILPYLAVNLVMGAAALGALFLSEAAGLPDVQQLVLTVGVGALVYALTSLWLNPPLLGDLRRVVGLRPGNREA